jgi:hypothetical protein
MRLRYVAYVDVVRPEWEDAIREKVVIKDAIRGDGAEVRHRKREVRRKGAVEDGRVHWNDIMPRSWYI